MIREDDDLKPGDRALFDSSFEDDPDVPIPKFSDLLNEVSREEAEERREGGAGPSGGGRAASTSGHCNSTQSVTINSFHGSDEKRLTADEMLSQLVRVAMTSRSDSSLSSCSSSVEMPTASDASTKSIASSQNKSLDNRLLWVIL